MHGNQDRPVAVLPDRSTIAPIALHTAFMSKVKSQTEWRFFLSLCEESAIECMAQWSHGVRCKTIYCKGRAYQPDVSKAASTRNVSLRFTCGCLCCERSRWLSSPCCAPVGF